MINSYDCSMYDQIINHCLWIVFTLVYSFVYLIFHFQRGIYEKFQAKLLIYLILWAVCELLAYISSLYYKAHIWPWLLHLLNYGSFNEHTGEGHGNHSSILAWRILWTEESGGLQSMGCKESDRTEKLTFSHSYKHITSLSLRHIWVNMKIVTMGFLLFKVVQLYLFSILFSAFFNSCYVL